LALAPVLALSLLVASCRGDRPSDVERAIGEAAAGAFGAPLDRIACVHAGEPPVAACVVALAGLPAFLVDVTGRDDDGYTWKARGARNIERVIRAGVATQLGVLPGAVSCPDRACVRDSFECRVTLLDGTEIPVQIEPDEPRETFAWRTKGVLRVAKLVAFIREQLGERGADADIDCGAARLRVAAPGSSFDCRVRYADSGDSVGSAAQVVARVHVQTWKGRVDVEITDRAGGDAGSRASGDVGGGDGSSSSGSSGNSGNSGDSGEPGEGEPGVDDYDPGADEGDGDPDTDEG
jgi:hypothetical protein